ncbi:MAG: winged helix-turn-helix transcriptional regulator [Tissierellia bacterium]|nr:winged helix-turn-helix transcriptional regulator [Tissierellia bacterium]
MKRREEEILEIIHENPLISQKDIAAILNITRSSVGVHINNLTKKGKIIGRGYVLSKTDKIVVLGGANIDFLGKPDEELIKDDSNIGKINLSIGGSARNIAENLVRLGIETELITAIGNDSNGDLIKNHCRKVGLRLSNANFFDGETTSTFLGLKEQNGDLLYTVSDMSIMDLLTPSVIAQKKSDIEHSELIIMDTNLPQETIEYIASNFSHKRILVDPVSVKKAVKLERIWKHIYYIQPNLKELEAMTNINADNAESLEKAVNILLEGGITHVLVTLGYKGAYYATKGEHFYVKAPKVEIVDPIGWIQAYFAGVAYGMYYDLSTKDSIDFGRFASALTLESTETISPWLNTNEIEERIKADE